MRSFPKHLNTKQDYLNCEQLVNEGKLPMEKLIEAYEALINTSKHYVFGAQLEEEKDRSGSEKVYRVLPNQQSEDRAGEKAFTQFKLADNPNSKMKQLGLTAAAIDKKISEINEGVK